MYMKSPIKGMQITNVQTSFFERLAFGFLIQRCNIQKIEDNPHAEKNFQLSIECANWITDLDTS